jgi:hypothetical protein
MIAQFCKKRSPFQNYARNRQMRTNPFLKTQVIMNYLKHLNHKEKLMKKTLFLIRALILGTSFLSAQEAPAGMTPEQIEAAKTRAAFRAPVVLHGIR